TAFLLFRRCINESCVVVFVEVTRRGGRVMKSKVASKAPATEAAVDQALGSQMLIEERRQYIVGLAQQHGRVLVEELSQSLGISRITIRKDLDYLQRRGALQRTHGGALLPQSGTVLDPYLKES